MTAHSTYSGSIPRGLVALAAGLLLAGPAAATHIALDVGSELGELANAMDGTTLMLGNSSKSVVVNEDGSVRFENDPMTAQDGSWELQWAKINLEEHPFVHFAQSFTNASGSAADLAFSTSRATGSIERSTPIGGSSRVAVAVADDLGSPALANAMEKPGYRGRLAASSKLTLLGR